MEMQIELKQVLGAIIFAARQPLTTSEIRKILQETAQTYGEEASVFAAAKEADIRAALGRLRADCETQKPGFDLVESAEGFRFQSDPAGGLWVRHMLDVGKPTKLSRPALETLAIIAYRQPISRAEMEGVRGVTVDHVLRMLMEMQLIKIVGRSELPGRPMLYGTTQLFLEHFGLKDIKQLPGIEELARMEVQKRKETPAPVQEAAPTEPVAQPKAEGVTESSGTEVAT
jgi:segregation and condensation protein B